MEEIVGLQGKALVTSRRDVLIKAVVRTLPI